MILYAIIEIFNLSKPFQCIVFILQVVLWCLCFTMRFKCFSSELKWAVVASNDKIKRSSCNYLEAFASVFCIAFFRSGFLKFPTPLMSYIYNTFYVSIIRYCCKNKNVYIYMNFWCDPFYMLDFFLYNWRKRVSMEYKFWRVFIQV